MTDYKEHFCKGEKGMQGICKECSEAKKMSKKNRKPMFFEDETHDFIVPLFFDDNMCGDSLYFGMKKPAKNNHSFVEVSTWSGVSSRDNLWIRLTQGKSHIIISSKAIRDLSNKLMGLQMLPEEEWEKTK